MLQQKTNKKKAARLFRGIKNLKQTFDKIDVDKTGFLDYDEFRRAILGPKATVTFHILFVCASITSHQMFGCLKTKRK